jgi:replicative DNA helicase
VIRETAGRRQIIRIAGDLQRAAVSDGDPVGVLVERAVKTLAEAGVLGQTGSWVRISEVLDEEFQRIDSMAREGEGPGGLPTGLDKLTEEIGGMRPGQLIVLAARPGMGKTALALNVAQHVSLLPDHPAVAIFSLEMTRQELVGRMMSSHTEIDARRLREGRSLVESEWELLEAKLEELRPTRVYIDDTPSLSIGEVKARCRKLKADDPSLALIVIDYLQLMRGDDHRAQRIQQVGEISQGLKALAKDVRVPVIALSQLNRSVESRQDKRPVLSDLRESGAIEQDADVILFIYRDDYYNKDSDCPGQAEVIIAKQRAGNTGTVRVVWEAPIQRFSNLFEGAVLR